MKIFNRSEALVVKPGTLLFGKVVKLPSLEGEVFRWSGCLLRVERVSLGGMVWAKVIKPPLRPATFPVGRVGEVLGVTAPLLTRKNFVLVNRQVTLQTVMVWRLVATSRDVGRRLTLYRRINVLLRFSGSDGHNTLFLPVDGLVGFYSAAEGFALTGHAVWQLLKKIYEAGIEAESPWTLVNERIQEQIIFAAAHASMELW